MGKTTRKTTIDFINESNIIHNNRYDYSLVVYINNKIKIRIICPIHGEFEQIPKNHLLGCNCPHCGFNNQVYKRRKHTLEFVNESNIIHNNRYDYSLVNYKNANTKVKIICPEHGEFEQTSKGHITLKQGCPSCYNELRKYNAPSWNKNSWIETANQSTHFDCFKLYKIRCYNETESFIKIGRTFNKLQTRLSEIPYQYEILKIVESDDGGYIFDLEKRIKDIYHNKKYIPLIKFGGMYECFII
jgi:ssDNA-binding Zn-finger/Zn-ribbon topoisomerase 1